MFEEQIKNIVKSYKGLDTSNCCSFAAVSDDGKIQSTHILHVCHAPLVYIGLGLYDQIITSYPVADKIDLDFFEFMKTQLYRKWSDHFLLEQTEEGKYYIRISNLSKIPANVVFNFCICSRAIVEVKDHVVTWSKLVAQGLHPIFAFALCRASYIDAEDLDGPVYSCTWMSGHWPCDHTLDLKTFLSGPSRLSKNFKDSPESCTPTNNIWGNSGDLKELKGISVREFWEKWKTTFNTELK